MEGENRHHFAKGMSEEFWPLSGPNAGESVRAGAGTRPTRLATGCPAWPHWPRGGSRVHSHSQRGWGYRARVSEGQGAELGSATVGVQSQGQRRPGYRATVNEGQGHCQQGPGCRVVVSEGQGAGSWSARAGVQGHSQPGPGRKAVVGEGQGARPPPLRPPTVAEVWTRERASATATVLQENRADWPGTSQ